MGFGITMSNEAAAECVEQWLTARENRDPKTTGKPGMPPDVSGKPDWQVKSEYIAAEDENGALHRSHECSAAP